MRRRGSQGRDPALQAAVSRTAGCPILIPARVMEQDTSHSKAGAPRPLILTLGVDAGSQARFEAERRRYFPTRLNRIPAHISLFHALPGEDEAAIRAVSSGQAQRTPFALEVYDLMRLGRGVAYAVRAPELDQLHRALRDAWLPALSRQDQQPFRPHVVIQNKVDPGEARALYDRLAARFRPWTIRARSLLLWHYEGGPWSAAAEFPFTAAAMPDPAAGEQR